MKIMRNVIEGVTVVKLLGLWLGIIVLLSVACPTAVCAHPMLSQSELTDLLTQTVPRVEVKDPARISATYADLNADGVPELFVGALADDARRGDFLILAWSNDECRLVYHQEWHNNTDYSIEFRSVRLSRTLPRSLAVVTYSPGFGTGYQPIYKDVIGWDGHNFTVFWSGRVGGYEVISTDGAVVELTSTLSFRQESDGLYLDITTFWRETTGAGHLMPPRWTFRSFKWDQVMQRFL